MGNLNDSFRYLHLPLPSDISRRIGMGDFEGSLVLIDRLLASNPSPELAARLSCERLRLARTPIDFTFDRFEALAELRKEWSDCSAEQFDQLVLDGRIDWRVIHGTPRFHRRFVESLRLYPNLAPGLNHPAVDNTYRDSTLERMQKEGSLSAYITIRASIRTKVDVSGKKVQAWLPVPALAPQQDWVEVIDATPGCIGSPEDAPQRTFHWDVTGQEEFFVLYRYFLRAPYVNPLTIKADPIQPTFCLDEQFPHIQFTPYLRTLSNRITAGLSDPVLKAKAIYDYVTGCVDYRFQPAYILLDSIADQCARDLRGDCGMFALLFITLCRLAGIPAKWQSGLAVEPDSAGAHDWAMFYIAPHGWLWADCSYGSSARREGNEWRRTHYFGNLDPWRMVCNSEFQAPLSPPMTGWRHDPYDNQTGEIMVAGEGLTVPDRETSIKVLEYQLL